MHLCFPMEIKKAADKDADIDNDLITLKKALESDAANYVAEKAEENLFGQLKKMSMGISNLQIEKAFKALNDQNIDEKFCWYVHNEPHE